MSDTAHPDLSVRHPDRRIARTVTALVEAFTDQARLQPVAEITVTNLVERAGIGRSTFYDHFGSIESLLLWLVDALVDWARDDDGRLQLDALLTFVAEMREVTSAFLEMDACASRCETAFAEALNGADLATRHFAAAGAMGSLRVWLADDEPPIVEEFVARTCALVEAVLAAGPTEGSMQP